MEHEVDDRLRVFKAVRVMLATGLADDLDRSTQCLIAFFDEVDIFRNGHDFIGITYDRENRDFRFNELAKIINRIELIIHRLLLGESIGLKATFPIYCRA